jgi:heme oxygenase
MLHETLKQATRANHDQLEQLMYVNDIMSGTLTAAQYKQILITNYLVHKAFESGLFSSLSGGIAQQLDLPRREKLTALQKDIAELAEDITFGPTDAEILGAMYVLEGATLGGSVIVKRLKTNPQLSHLTFNYYQVYGDQLIPMWKQFCAVLDEQPESNSEGAVTGAKKMFGYIAAVQQQNSLV